MINKIVSLNFTMVVDDAVSNTISSYQLIFHSSLVLIFGITVSSPYTGSNFYLQQSESRVIFILSSTYNLPRGSSLNFRISRVKLQLSIAPAAITVNILKKLKSC